MSRLRGFAFGAAGLSLQRQLVIWVLLPQLVLWAAGGVATYRLAVRYVNQAADATLSQVARTLARQVKPIGDGLLIDFPRAAQDVLEADPNDRLQYTVSSPPGKFILGNNNIPMPPSPMVPRLNEPYFYDADVALDPKVNGRQLIHATKARVAALYLRYGEQGGEPQWRLAPGPALPRCCDYNVKSKNGHPTTSRRCVSIRRRRRCAR
jgi:two-component system sensor histidine kinase TctE